MKLDKAIEILENDPPRPHPLNRDEFKEAFQLGIEALKRIKTQRYEASTFLDDGAPLDFDYSELLIGETKD